MSFETINKEYIKNHKVGSIEIEAVGRLDGTVTLEHISLNETNSGSFSVTPEQEEQLFSVFKPVILNFIDTRLIDNMERTNGKYNDQIKLTALLGWDGDVERAHIDLRGYVPANKKVVSPLTHDESNKDKEFFDKALHDMLGDKPDFNGNSFQMKFKGAVDPYLDGVVMFNNSNKSFIMTDEFVELAVKFVEDKYKPFEVVKDASTVLTVDIGENNTCKKVDTTQNFLTLEQGSFTVSISSLSINEINDRLDGNQNQGKALSN